MHTFLRFLFITLVFCCYGLAAFPQTEQGQWMLFGGSDLKGSSYTRKFKSDTSNVNKYNYKDLGIELGVGYAIKDGLVLGLSAPLYFAKKTFDQTKYNEVTTRYILTPFVKYYMGYGLVKPYVQANAGLGTNIFRKNYAMGAVVRDKDAITRFSGLFGIGIFPSQTFSLDTGIGYYHDIVKRKNNNEENTRTIESGLLFNLSFNAWF